MTTAGRTGYDDRVDYSRAMPSSGNIEADPSFMVQEQLARLNFLASRVELAGKRVLEIGAGTGFGCQYLVEKFGAAETLGTDISRPTVEFAAARYPERKFAVADACDRSTDFGRWDVVICCEVIEHVPDPAALLDVIAAHLAPGGTAFVTTPNKTVFSLGYEPSPVNETHLREYLLDELQAELGAKFAQVETVGQRLTDPIQLERRQKIVRRNISDFRLLGRLYWNRRFRHLWKIARLEPLRRALDGRHVYAHRDFAFSPVPCDDAIWFCSLLRDPR